MWHHRNRTRGRSSYSSDGTGEKCGKQTDYGFIGFGEGSIAAKPRFDRCQQWIN